jgi:hypothetical protein
MEFAPFTVQNMPDCLRRWADDGLAAGFDDAGADEQVLFAEFGIVHTSRVGCEIVSFVADLPGHIGIGGLNRMEGGDEFRDLAFIEPTFLMEADPGVAAFGVVGIEQACQVPQMLACVEQIANLNCAGKVLLGQIPDPFGSVAYNDLLLGAAPPAFPGFHVESLPAWAWNRALLRDRNPQQLG